MPATAAEGVGLLCGPDGTDAASEPPSCASGPSSSVTESGCCTPRLLYSAEGVEVVRGRRSGRYGHTVGPCR
eukprot:194972-Prymnesium_polylepis.1